ncbi:MAG: hypothetical protein IIC63_04335 [Proteobacteria bacterium]|nr:hypothetical protein [Pseudomonadota bacterium]
MDTDIITALVKKTTKKWTKQRKAEERSAAAAMRRRDVMVRSYRTTVRDAAFDVMEDAYMKASANGTLPAGARQIMYAARGRIQELTGRTLNDQYFTQTLLPDYMDEYSVATASWDVVFDARGNFIEPYSTSPVPLGTIQVRDYVRAVQTHSMRPATDNPEISIDTDFPTKGPRNRFGAILFLEKEGFAPLLKKVKLAQRYDIAIMSTKGLSVTAARRLVDEICDHGDVPLLIARDFDKAGFSIASTLQNDTRRYQFMHDINVIDLGLRLDDVEKWELESEDVSYGKTDPSWNLRDNGATAEEIEFLHHGYDYARGHHGRRVEMNAFTSDQFVKWLESKLDEVGVKKIVPDDATLALGYRRAVKIVRLEQVLEEISAEEQDDIDEPTDLRERIEEALEDDPAQSWDQALNMIAADDLEEDE